MYPDDVRRYMGELPCDAQVDYIHWRPLDTDPPSEGEVDAYGSLLFSNGKEVGQMECGYQDDGLHIWSEGSTGIANPTHWSFLPDPHDTFEED